MIVLKIAILLFSMMELSNVLIMYFKPDFKYGNSMRSFRLWFTMQEKEENRLFVKYMVNWVANCKLIFLALLMVVVLFGNEVVTIGAVCAMILSIGIYFISLHPIIAKLDALGEIQPKGYSKTLALMIVSFMILFCVALGLYFVL